MDSGNSSSVQSSSGGDEEAESISTFLSPHRSLHTPRHQPSHLPTTTSPRRHHPPPLPTSFFDPLSSYLDPFTRSPPPPPAAANSDSLLNLDMSWAGGLRTFGQPNCTDVGGGLLGSALPPRNSTTTAPFGPGRGPYTGSITINPLPSPSSSPLHQPPLAPPPEPPSNTAAANPPRSSRKRSRASRRAPTTVLTTDTSNFRAMVQEFTGIPAPPFSSSPSLFPPRSRFDLFHAATSSAVRPPGVLGAAPHSLLRPFAQKVPVPSFGPFAPGSSFSSSCSAPTITTTVSAAATTSRTNSEGSMTRLFATNPTAANASSTSISTNTTSIANSYQLPSLGDQQESLLNMYNFQSLQSSPSTRYNSLDAAALGAARAMQESRVMPPVVDYAVGGGLGPASEGMPSSRGGGNGGDDLLQWVEGSGGSEGGG